MNTTPANDVATINTIQVGQTPELTFTARSIRAQARRKLAA